MTGNILKKIQRLHAFGCGDSFRAFILMCNLIKKYPYILDIKSINNGLNINSHFEYAINNINKFPEEYAGYPDCALLMLGCAKATKRVVMSDSIKKICAGILRREDLGDLYCNLISEKY